MEIWINMCIINGNDEGFGTFGFMFITYLNGGLDRNLQESWERVGLEFVRVCLFY